MKSKKKMKKKFNRKRVSKMINDKRVSEIINEILKKEMNITIERINGKNSKKRKKWN